MEIKMPENWNKIKLGDLRLMPECVAMLKAAKKAAAAYSKNHTDMKPVAYITTIGNYMVQTYWDSSSRNWLTYTTDNILGHQHGDSMTDGTRVDAECSHLCMVGDLVEALAK